MLNDTPFLEGHSTKGTQLETPVYKNTSTNSKTLQSPTYSPSEVNNNYSDATVKAAITQATQTAKSSSDNVERYTIFGGAFNHYI
jgi:hypothetical protein